MLQGYYPTSYHNFYDRLPMASKSDSLHKYPDAFFPDTYMVIDLETTGFSPRSDYITQFALAVIRERKLASNVSFLLQIPEGSMNKKASEVTGITEEMCQEHGMPRPEAMHNIYATLSNWRNVCQGVFVGHNASKFDIPFLEAAFKRHSIDFLFRDHEIVDTGAMVKSMQMGTWPLPTETLRGFMNRMLNVYATGVYWSLDRFCLDRFKLRERLEKEGLKSHDAGADCVVTHWVLEALRAEREEQIEKHGAHIGG